MTQSAWTRDGRPVDAATFSSPEWEQLKQSAQLGDFMMSCCKAPAVLKTSINGLPFFAHLSDECATAPETDDRDVICAFVVQISRIRTRIGGRRHGMPMAIEKGRPSQSIVPSGESRGWRCDGRRRHGLNGYPPASPDCRGHLQS